MSLDWKVQEERGSRLAIQSMVWTAKAFGRPVARALLYPICAYYLFASRRAGRAVRQYYRRLRGSEPGWRDLFHHYYWFASVILDRVFFLRGRFDQFEIRIHGLDMLDGLLRKERGCLLLGSHLGSFEVVRVVGLSCEQIEVRVLMDEQNAPLLRELTQELNPTVAGTVIHVGGVDTMLKVKECLERGGVVGMMGDRLMSEERAVACDFLGGKVLFPTGSVRLAHVTRAPMVLFFGLYRGGNRYDVYLELLTDSVQSSSNGTQRDVQHWTQQYADRLAYFCRQAPDNWFNFYDFWQAP